MTAVRVERLVPCIGPLGTFSVAAARVTMQPGATTRAVCADPDLLDVCHAENITVAMLPDSTGSRAR